MDIKPTETAVAACVVPRALEIARRVLTEEEAKRHHVVIALSGAHAYGFPSPDSDLDLKGMHLADSRALLGLGSAREAHDRLEVIEGVEIDYTSNEMRGVILGILGGNGNYIERVLGALIMQTSPEHEQLKELVQASLSQRVYRHYNGFAWGQRRSFLEAAQPSAKKLLYVLRTALTGVHLLRTGELRVDLTSIAEQYGYGDVQELIAAKRKGEKAILPTEQRDQWNLRLDTLFTLLDQALETSPLPKAPPNRVALEEWLIEQRCKRL